MLLLTNMIDGASEDRDAASSYSPQRDHARDACHHCGRHRIPWARLGNGLTSTSEESATVPEARCIVRRPSPRDQFLDCCPVMPSPTVLGSPTSPRDRSPTSPETAAGDVVRGRAAPLAAAPGVCQPGGHAEPGGASADGLRQRHPRRSQPQLRRGPRHVPDRLRESRHRDPEAAAHHRRRRPRVHGPLGPRRSNVPRGRHARH